MKRMILAAAGFGLALAGLAAAEPVALDVKNKDGVALTGDPAAGETAYGKCKQCHSLEQGKNMVGPSLFKILGRTAGTVEGFNYSAANKNSGIVWSEQILFDYLEAPMTYMKGTKMAFVGLKKEDERANVIAYLKTHGGQ